LLRRRNYLRAAAGPILAARGIVRETNVSE
jgi:hypothetical protein